MVGERLYDKKQESSPSNTKDELKARMLAAFTNFNKYKIGKACRNFRSHLESVVDQRHFLWLNLINKDILM